MNKQLLKNYIHDRKGFILIYLFCSSSLIFYFNFITIGENSILYPVLFITLPFFVFLLFDSSKYMKFNQRLLSNIEGVATDLSPSTYEQQLVNQLLLKMSIANSQQYQQLKEHHRENLYFLSHLMHHLKAPLSVIEIICNDETNTKEGNEAIQQQATRIRQTVDQALSLVRTDAFENDLAIQPVDIIALLQQCINEHKKECIQSNIYPKIVCPVKQIFVITDSKWCKVLLQQLISNAIKYSALKDGKKTLSFIIEHDKAHVTLSIVDEGIGIPHYDQHALFQPFFTGENGRKVTHSSGIGLYICQKICNRLDHELSFVSKQHEGSTFTIKMKASTQNKNLTNM